MNANKLADKLQDCYEKDVVIDSSATMLRQQQAEINELKDRGYNLVLLLNDLGIRLKEAKAEIEALKKQSEYHRWNIEEDGDDLLICRNEHEKGENCEYVRYTST